MSAVGRHIVSRLCSDTLSTRAWKTEAPRQFAGASFQLQSRCRSTCLGLQSPCSETTDGSLSNRRLNNSATKHNISQVRIRWLSQRYTCTVMIVIIVLATECRKKNRENMYKTLENEN